MSSEKTKEQLREEARLRVEEKKQEFIARKEKYKGKALRITAELLEGIDFEDTVFVKLKNGEVGELTIRPLGEGEIIKIFDDVGFEAIEDMTKDEDSFDLKDYQFFWAIVSASSGLPIDLIKKTFAIGESASVGNVVLEMSGFSPDAGDVVEGFPEK